MSARMRALRHVRAAKSSSHRPRSSAHPSTAADQSCAVSSARSLTRLTMWTGTPGSVHARAMACPRGQGIAHDRVVNAAARSAMDPRRVYSDVWIDQVLQWFVLSTHYRVVSLLPVVLIGVVLARWA